MSKKVKILIFVLCFIIMLFLTYLFIIGKLHDFDYTVFSFVKIFRCDILTIFFKGISFLCSVPCIIILSLLLFLVFKNKKYALISLISICFITSINVILKFLFLRQRPISWMIIVEYGYSFPSGHAMASMAFYGMLIFLIYQTNKSKIFKRICTFLLTVLIILIGISRIYLGVHYASDVIIGFCISLCYLIVITTWLKKYIDFKKLMRFPI